MTADDDAYSDALAAWTKTPLWNLRRRVVLWRVRSYWPVLRNALDALRDASPEDRRQACERVLRAWIAPGVRPDVHRDSQHYIREMLPELGASLDRAAIEARKIARSA